MRLVFADSAFYIALLNQRDELHDPARHLARQLNSETGTRFITTDAVLVEVFAYAAGRGTDQRTAALNLRRRLRRSPSVEIIEQTRDLLDRGIALYAARPDKRYSLVDCLSMAVCRDRRIAGVLTHDRDFAQEGLTTLL